VISVFLIHLFLINPKKNETDKPRKILYVTYAKESEGDFRERYYRDKRASFPPDIEREEGKVYQYKI